ncbi:Fe-Mn family superoxide dismutase [Marinicrinis sediminis]|uniref:superoxide dismutase n=1 Tax=Marinicrinis sediminis TaxID=1652465 RepID=A0ABW5RG17_9BACL
MLMIYGRMMPMRILEEIRFWKTQEEEHTVVIRSLVNQLEQPFVQLMKEWEQVFAQNREAANAWIEQELSASPVPPSASALTVEADQLQPFIDRCVYHSQAFIKQLYQMMEHSRVIRKNHVARTVILHIIRESEYFLNVMHALLQQEAAAEEKGSDIMDVRLGSRQQSLSLSSWTEGTWSEYAGGSNTGNTDAMTSVPIGQHRLPPLPYPYDALEPYIDEQTMRLHHDEHHLSYVKGLNQAELQMQKAREQQQYDLIKHWEREAAFHGAGHYLHTIFWDVMTPKGGGKPEGSLRRQIEQDFGRFEAFKQHFSKSALTVEGSGWSILVWSPRARRLEILQAEKHQNLSQWDVIPLLPLDVWEHAYYLRYPNNRAAYIDAWWNVVNWPTVQERFNQAKQVAWQPY